MVLPGDRAIARRIEKRCPARTTAKQRCPHWHFCRKGCEAVPQMKRGVGRQKFPTQVGDQIRRKKKAESGLREKTERAVMAIQHGGIEGVPLGFPDEGADFIIRLTTVERTL